jgi:hypothetical protein
MTSTTKIEIIGKIAPVAGSLIVLAADAGTFDADEEELLPAIKKTIGGWPENWAKGDRRDINLVKLSRAEAFVFALRGWNMMADVCRLGEKIMIVDPGLDFWTTGGSAPQPTRGHEMATAFSSALMATPNSGENLGNLHVSSGKLLVTDAWRACD